MRLILEKSEIVKILGKHFEAKLDPDKVIIRTDPEFEIEVSGLPLSDSPEEKEEPNVVPLHTQTRRLAKAEVDAPKAITEQRDDPDATTEPPSPGKDGNEGVDAAAVHPAAVLAASKALEQELDKENPQLSRRSGRWSTIAPTNPSDEI